MRIKPKSSSEAAKDEKIAHIYLLFNVKKADANVDPFLGNESGNNQVILISKDKSIAETAFFAVYQKQSLGYPIRLFLQTDFDLPGHVGRVVPGAPDSRYYVPRACAECHGHSINGLKGDPVDASGQKTSDFKTGTFKFAKPNYLDTDQWYDWMDFDYRGVAGSLNDVIFDGGKDHDSPRYSRSFEVVRKLNKDILTETVAAEAVPGKESFSSLAARKWWDLHSTSNARKPYSLRAIGKEKWDESNIDEMRLLRALNNHCFRCHSSLRYNVFDKEAVRVRRKAIRTFLNLEVKDANGNRLLGYFMPQGRVLSDAERKEILDLTTKVLGN